MFVVVFVCCCFCLFVFCCCFFFFMLAIVESQVAFLSHFVETSTVVFAIKNSLQSRAEDVS